ncbi:MAG: hypothetical protein R2746_01470 [Acidimicrobiales bacterium]
MPSPPPRPAGLEDLEHLRGLGPLTFETGTGLGCAEIVAEQLG